MKTNIDSLKKPKKKKKNLVEVNFQVTEFKTLGSFVTIYIFLNLHVFLCVGKLVLIVSFNLDLKLDNYELFITAESSKFSLLNYKPSYILL